MDHTPKHLFCICFLAWSAILVILPALVMGDDHIVGANRGWQVPAESGVDLNYSKWAAQERFYLGDFISFHYQKGLHTVYEVNKTVYESCDFGSGGRYNSIHNISTNSTSAAAAEESAVGATSQYRNVVRNWSTKGGRSIVPLNESRVYYFACGVGEHCLQGMKVAVSVLPLTRPASSLSAQQAPSAYPGHSSSCSSLHLISLFYLSLLFCGIWLLLSPP